MWRYLAVGLVTDIEIGKSEIEMSKLNIEQLQERMEENFYYVPQLYNITENDDMYHFTIKDELFHSQLISLLEVIYPFLYGKDDRYYLSSLQKLKGLLPSKWLETARDKSEETFQFDKYGDND